MNYDGYIVSFMPGARGRLISNIVFKLINEIDTSIEFTNLNSAHNYIDNVSYVVDPRTIVLPFAAKSVYWTHSYPADDWPKNLGIIFINCSTRSLPEVLLNAAIKNIFPKLEKMSTGEDLTETENKFISFYKRSYPALDINLLINEHQRDQFLREVTNDNFLQSILYSKFINNNAYEGYKIEYDRMFDLKNGRYVTIENISDYLGIVYNPDIHHIYEKYDMEKYNIFAKYCPWFLKEKKYE